VAGQGEKSVQHALEHWATACGRQVAELAGYIYRRQDEDAVRHVFTVASSLDSMVLGEPQILGQLKEAYRQAAEGTKTGPILNRLLHKAFSTAKRVRTETAVASSAVSISYAAVELAKRIFGDMSGYTAMLVGAGEMAELAAMHLIQAGVQRILVANRTYERGADLARQFNGEAVAFDSLFDHLAETDIVITSTGAPEAIIHAEDIQEVLKRRRHRPMFFIDIAVPRDVAPDVNSLDNVYLYDIDDLKEVVEENLANRRDEAAKARHIVAEEVGAFMRWMEQLHTQPTIVAFIRRGERIVEEELGRTLRRLGPVDDDTHAALRAMASAMARKFNHDPIHFLKNGGMESEAPPERIHLMRRMFRLDGEPEALPPRRCRQKG
jgi:glutamyl-tRNA reductase